MFKKFRNVNPKKMKVSKFEDTPIGVKVLTAGTAACVADFATFPLDTAKVRLQVQGEGKIEGHIKGASPYRGIFNTIATIVKEEGPKSLYNGLSAGLQRQMCFGSVRIGFYDSVKVFYQQLIGGERTEKGGVDVLARISAGLTTGGLAVLVAQPTDVVKVRFQARRGREERYKSTTEAYKTIFKHEGVRGLWKGTYPNVARNAIVNVSEIVCYDIVKEAILNTFPMKDNILCHFTSASIAGVCTTIVASPVDVIKTRYMNSPKGQYKSAINCAVKTIKTEGVTALYKGFTPSSSRLILWNIVMWVTYEKFKFFVTKAFSEN